MQLIKLWPDHEVTADSDLSAPAVPNSGETLRNAAMCNIPTPQAAGGAKVNGPGWRRAAEGFNRSTGNTKRLALPLAMGLAKLVYNPTKMGPRASMNTS